MKRDDGDGGGVKNIVTIVTAGSNIYKNVLLHVLQ
jgi:hypothetical protein